MVKYTECHSRKFASQRWAIKAGIWLLWFFLLTATPYHLAEPYRGPVLTGFYGWVSLGLFLGCCVAVFWRQTGSRYVAQSSVVFCGLLSPVASKAAAVVGFLLALLVCCPEWMLLPLAYQVNPEMMYSLSDWLPPQLLDVLPQPLVAWRVAIENVGGVCLLVSGFLCAITLFVPGGPGGSRSKQGLFGLRQKKDNEVPGLPVFDSSTGCLVRSATSILLLVGFSLGAFGQMVNYYSFHLSILDDPYRLHLNAPTDAIWSSAPPLPSVVLPGVAALLLGLSCLFCEICGKEGSKGLPQETGGLLSLLGSGGIFAEKLLAFYCLGALGWNFLSRSTAYVYSLMPLGVWQVSVVLEAVLLGVFVMAVLGLFAASRLRTRAGAASRGFGCGNGFGGASLTGGPSFSGHMTTMELAAIFGDQEVAQLSEREWEALQNHLAGLSSADSAERMGLKASTVRAYLQRVYKKLDVADGEELGRAVAAASDAGAKEGAMAPAEDAGDDAKRARAEKLFTALAKCMACLALPTVLLVTGFLGCDAFLGRALPFGCGLGFMVAAVVFWGGRGKGGFISAKSLMALAGIVAFAVVSTGAAWAGLVEAGVEVALFVLATAGAFLVAIALLAPYREAQVGEAYVFGGDERTGLLLMAVSACVGMVFQAQWFLPDAPIAGMLLPACLVLIWALSRVLFARRIWGNVVLIPTIIACLMNQSSAFVEAAVVLALLLSLLAKVPFLSQWQSGCLLCLGAGMSFGRLASNVVNDLTKTSSWLFGHTSPDDPLFLMVGFGVSVAILLVVGWIAFAFFRSMREEKSVWEWRASGRILSEWRIEAYFKAKGLNETQSTIAAKLAMGFLAAEISEAFYYSRATIDQSRTIAYAAMRVHDQAAFIEAVNRELTVSDSTN